MTAIPLLLFGRFGSDDGDDLEAVAERLETRPTTSAVTREIEQISECLDELVAAARLASGPNRRVDPDAGPGEKARALRHAVEHGTAGFADGGDGRSSTPDEERAAAIPDAADRVGREQRPTDRLSRRLVDDLAAPADPDEVEETLSRTVIRLEDSSNRDRLAEEVEALLDELGVDDGDPLPRRVRTAVRQVTSEVDEDGDGVTTAVLRAREEVTPRSKEARELFEALEAGQADRVSDALSVVAAQLDEYASARSLLENVSSNDVDRLAAEVDRELEDLDGPVAEQVAERVDELQSREERVDDSNRVLTVAANEELKFYRRELVPAIASRPAAAGDADGGDVTARLRDLRDRRDRVETEYVETRSDHNHSIPLYFLSTVDDSLDDAEAAIARGDGDRATGILEIVDAVLETIEGLYEQNQYSVMLRSLRG